MDGEISGLDQRGMVELREQLLITKRECNEKIKHLLHQHYPALISASKVRQQKSTTKPSSGCSSVCCLISAVSLPNPVLILASKGAVPCFLVS